MARIVLTDGSGRWFDPKKCQRFEEDTYFDGNNHVSRATGTQWNHEELYRTAGGRWILESTSQWQGSVDHYEEIDNEQAAAWLAQNDHEPHEACAKEFAALEVA